MGILEKVKKLVSDTLNDEEISISIYYDLIKSGDNVDRWDVAIEDMIYDANNSDKKAWIVISQTDDGEITYITRDIASYDFEFDLQVYTPAPNRDEMFEKMTLLISNLSNKSHEVDGNTINMGFKNPNVELPDIINDDELVTITLNGTCSICNGRVITHKDLIDVAISIPTLNIPMTRMPIITNLPKYSINPENVQTTQTGYYTNILTYRVGIESMIRVVCDLNNPVCRKMFELCKKRLTNPTFRIKVDEKIANIEFSTERVVNSVDFEVTDNGIVLLVISTFVMENTTYEGVEE